MKQLLIAVTARLLKVIIYVRRVYIASLLKSKLLVWMNIVSLICERASLSYF